MTIYLVRHASAGTRGASFSDADRRLDAVGLDQADAIAEVLGDQPITSVLSSRALRCTQTVGALAAQLGVEVVEHPALWEGQRSDAAVALVDDLILTDTTAVLCSHGDIIPGVLSALARRGINLASNGCSKGSLWILNIADRAIVSTSYRTTP